MPNTRKPIPPAVRTPAPPLRHDEDSTTFDPIGRFVPSAEILFHAWTVDGTEPTAQMDLFGVLPRTGVVRRLTNDSAAAQLMNDKDPDWSPDRTHLVATQVDLITPYLKIRDSAGAITQALAFGEDAVWMSPTTVLACVQRLAMPHVGSSWEIYAYELSGSSHQITVGKAGQYLSSPDWHPTEGLVACLSTIDVDGPIREQISSELVHITVASLNAAIATGTPIPTSTLQRFGPAKAWNADPSWSPDGRSVVYTTRRPCATVLNGTPVMQTDIAIMSTSGRWRPRLVTDDSAVAVADGVDDVSPVYSADGRWVAWCRGIKAQWMQIVAQRPTEPSSRRVVVADKHWIRDGLSW